MSTTSIEWTDKVWNPVRGCSRVSEGCRNCYAERFAARFSDPEQVTVCVEPGTTIVPAGHWHGYAERTPSGPRWTGKVSLVPEKLAEPLSWRKPARVFVNSTSDLFHEALSDVSIAAVFGAMAAAPHHTFQVLTKRPKRMREWFDWIGGGQEMALIADHLDEALIDAGIPAWSPKRGKSGAGPWPLPNVWPGVSVENQKTADERIPLLLQTPAAVRFVSYEPALGPVDFSPWLPPTTCPYCGHADAAHAPGGRSVGCMAGNGSGENPICGCRKLRGERTHVHGDPMAPHPDPAISWVIVGGESGPGARPFNLEWARSVVA